MKFKPKKTKVESLRLAPGARVVVRDEEWIVRKVEKSFGEDTAVHVTGMSELVRNKPAIFLHPLDTIRELRPEETEPVPDTSPGFRRTRLYLESLLQRTPPTDARLYAGHRAAIEPADYQLVPAAQALSRPQPRILIADGVGLGKTIEVGMLLSELIRRGRGDRILVVALKSILAQFQMELWSRFTIPLVRLDSVGLERVQTRIPSSANPFYHFNKAIISIDTLKKDAKYRRYLEASRWDAIVIDECQNVAVRSKSGARSMSDRARLAQLLATTTDSLILTSATPHDGRPESFASLINLLEPTAIADPTEYAAEEVRPWFVRRFKKDLDASAAAAFQDRQIEAIYSDAGVEEQRVFDTLKSLKLSDTRRSGGMLFRTSLLKAYLSSPAACLATTTKRLGKVDPESSDAIELEALAEALRDVGPPQFSKLRGFLDLLRELGWKGRSVGNRVVVFSERIDTLRFLEEQIQSLLGVKAKHIGVFWGTLDDQKQAALVKEFGTENGNVRILLCSDAAAEGINLHYYCHDLVHFDVPWSLITLEQRNGRIDRYGQRETPKIRYLLTRPRSVDQEGDLRVLSRLIDKENQAHQNLGDVAWLMDLHDSDREVQRIARGIEGGESPEQIIPDAPVSNDDLLALFLEDPDEDGPDTTDSSPETVEPPTLFEGSLGWVRAAFAELRGAGAAASGSDDVTDGLEWIDAADGFRVSVGDDLERRLALMPPELTDNRGEMLLTTDRKRVMDSLDDARQGDGSWPKWQLFWEQHPVSEWLGDRVLGLFTRHEAPVIALRSGLEPGEQLYVLQGIISNERSQPVIVDWLAVSGSESHGQLTVGDFEECVTRLGLDRELANAGLEVDVESIRARIPAVVEAGRAHMKQLRADRSANLRQELVEQERALKAWASACTARLKHEQDAVRAKGRSLSKAQTDRILAERARVDRVLRDRRAWFRSTLTTSDLPYLRVAAVITRPEHA